MANSRKNQLDYQIKIQQSTSDQYYINQSDIVSTFFLSLKRWKLSDISWNFIPQGKCATGNGTLGAILSMEFSK